METRRIAHLRVGKNALICSLEGEENATVCYIKVKMYLWNWNSKQLVQKITFTFTRAAPFPFYCCPGDGPPTDRQQTKKKTEKRIGFFFSPGLSRSKKEWANRKGASWKYVEQAWDVWVEMLLASDPLNQTWPYLSSAHRTSCAPWFSSHTLLGSHTLQLVIMNISLNDFRSYMAGG